MENKTKDLGITEERKDEADDAAEINKGGHNCGCCSGSECHIEWTDD